MKLKRWSEMLLLFLGMPILVYLTITDLTTWVMPLLGLTGLACLAVLLADNQFKRFRLWNFDGIGAHMLAALRLFLPWACLVSIAIYMLFPDLFLALPMQAPGFWLLTLLIYPLVSVIPQEIIFRTYFFHRYKHILPSKNARWAFSTFFFGLAHLVYGNWIAVVLSWIGGAIFGYRYMHSRSTVAVVVEHSLWGSFLFTIGLGAFFLI